MTEIYDIHKKDHNEGYFKAKFCNMKDISEKGIRIIGVYAFGNRNPNGEELVDFVLGNSFKIMNTTFPNHPEASSHGMNPNMMERPNTKLIISPYKKNTQS